MLTHCEPRAEALPNYEQCMCRKLIAGLTMGRRYAASVNVHDLGQHESSQFMLEVARPVLSLEPALHSLSAGSLKKS